MAFERGAGAEGDDRHAAPAQAATIAATSSVLAGEDHRVGRVPGMLGHVLAVLLAHRRGGR